MYLPFLRGKLYEFKAIKEFLEENENANKYVMPIIEPVKRDMKPMMSCIDVMGRKDMEFAIVLNSRLGDFRHDTFNVAELLNSDIIERIKWTPAFEVPDNSIDIFEFIKEQNLSNVMLMFLSGVDYENDRVQALVNNPAVRYLVVLNLGSNRTLQRKLKQTGKMLITIEDRFMEQASNSLYSANIDEFFTDTFGYYMDDQMFGFADFTCLPRNYREGGVLPPTVAIHLTYQKNPDEVYVHHFLSDSGRGKTNIRFEFKEAVDKIEPFFGKYKPTVAVRQLEGIDYPGLGAIKKFSIKNHLELMERILSAQI